MTPTPESRLAHDLGIPEQDLRFEALRNARNDALVAADRCLLADELLKYDLYMDVYATCQADMQPIGQARAKAKRDAQYASGKWPELPRLRPITEKVQILNAASLTTDDGSPSQLPEVSQ